MQPDKSRRGKSDAPDAYECLSASCAQNSISQGFIMNADGANPLSRRLRACFCGLLVPKELVLQEGS